MKVVISTCYGGFGVSHEAFLRLRELGHADALAEPDFGEYWSDGSGPRNRSMFMSDFLSCSTCRHDPLLVQVVEELGDAANGWAAKLEVIDIPDGVEYTIEEYDGLEHIAEEHRTWGT